MKKTRLILLIILMGLQFTSFAQDSCKVLVPALSGNYDGGCKKGLANGKGKAVGTDSYQGQFKKGYPDGKGTYTWSNGDFYEGEWSKGLRDGEGTLHYKKEGKDTIISGIWEFDKYKGPKLIPPIVLSKQNVLRYTITKEGNDRNGVYVILMRDGKIMKYPGDFFIEYSSGYESSIRNFRGIQNPQTIPYTFKIRYTLGNRNGLQQMYVTFDTKITQEGLWEITIYN